MGDPIREDYAAAEGDPTAQQILADALVRLERLRDETVESETISDELVRVALAMFAPTVRLLRYDLRMFEHSNAEQWERVAKASEAAGDLAIARAVLAARHEPHSAGVETHSSSTTNKGETP